MLGDGHVGLYFQAGNDGRLQTLGRRLHFLHHAVNAVAQPEFFRQWFQVDVRCAQLEGVYDDLIYQPNERRVRVHRPAVVSQSGDDGRVNFALREIQNGLVNGRVAAAAVIAAKRGLDVRLRRHAQFDFRVEQMRQRVNGVQVGRVGNGNGDLALGFEDGNDAVFFGDVARNDGNDVVGNLYSSQLNNFRAELRGLGLGHVRRANELVGQHQIHHAHARSLGFGARLGDLLGGHKAEVHQRIHQIIVLFCHDVFASHGITTRRGMLIEVIQPGCALSMPTPDSLLNF